MAEIQTALFMPFKFPATSYTATAVDDAGTNVRTFTVGTLWHIIEFAANAVPAGTMADPKNLLKYVESVLGTTRYVVALNSDGFVTVRNLTGTAATVTFASSVIPYALGFTSSVISVPASSTITADYQPTHCFYSFSREADTGWQSVGQIFAATDLPDGTVFGWGNGTARFKRTFNSKYHPKNDSYVTGSLANVTPIYPSITENRTQWKTPTDSPTLKGPWTVHNFLNSCINNGQGKIIAACFGNFTDNIAGIDTKFEQVSLSAESIKAEHFSLSIPGYDKFRNVDNLTFHFYSHQYRDIS